MTMYREPKLSVVPASPVIWGSELGAIAATPLDLNGTLIDSDSSVVTAWTRWARERAVTQAPSPADSISANVSSAEPVSSRPLDWERHDQSRSVHRHLSVVRDMDQTAPDDLSVRRAARRSPAWLSASDRVSPGGVDDTDTAA